MNEFKVPEGWKLVPVESTIEMDAAGLKAMSSMGAQTLDAECCYNAMIAAAPQPPVAPGAESQPDERAAFEMEWIRIGWGDADEKRQCEHFFAAGRASQPAGAIDKNAELPPRARTQLLHAERDAHERRRYAFNLR